MCLCTANEGIFTRTKKGRERRMGDGTQMFQSKLGISRRTLKTIEWVMLKAVRMGTNEKCAVEIEQFHSIELNWIEFKWIEYCIWPHGSWKSVFFSVWRITCHPGNWTMNTDWFFFYTRNNSKVPFQTIKKREIFISPALNPFYFMDHFK